ncbi:MAG: 4-hydroxythreonine-4-phosphate dehydrogenase PdxA [Spirochaetia bacterium]|nr:4-hydroxythreonine-4-phosphate dehydrogenase PdxA [Spirochaetia bacterium]
MRKNNHHKSDKNNQFYTIVSLGDPAGIGREILFKVFSNINKYFKHKERNFIKNCVIVGDLFEDEIIENSFDIIKYESINQIVQYLNEKKNTKPVYVYLKRNVKVTYGIAGKDTGKRSYEYLKTALEVWRSVKMSALVTLPVSKENIIKSGEKFSGHTETLEEFYKRKTYMCMYGKNCSVISLTTHIPLEKVPGYIKLVDYKNLANALLFYSRLFADKKPVAVMGLNPHAGENGKIGTEEKFIKEKMKFLKTKNINIEGPFAADGFFASNDKNKYSLAIAQYHDQGLIPFKILNGFEGLNITLNLPKLRVSPAHGTAYSIAGTDKADVKSIVNSLTFAFKWGIKWIQHFSYQH